MRKILPLVFGLFLLSIPSFAQYNGVSDTSRYSKTAPSRVVTSDPATCDAVSHEQIYNSTDKTFKICTDVNVWTAVAGNLPADALGYLHNDGSGNKTWTTGTAADPTVTNYTPTGGSANTITQQTANMKVIQFCTDWGACDGVTDDTAKWNLAVAQANGNSLEIRIPIGRTVLLHGPNIPSNTSVVCGNGATLKNSGSSTTSPLLGITFVHNWQLHNCTLDQNGIVQTGTNNALIYLQGDTNWTLDHITITNSGLPSPATGGVLVYASGGGMIDYMNIGPTILATHATINTYSPNQTSTSAKTLFGSNDSDNLLLVQAALPGTSGNSMTATIVNDGVNQTLSFTGTSAALTIHLATDASGVSTSTAGSIIQGFQGNALQRFFRITTYDTGTGIVAAAGTQTLAGGVDAYDKITVQNSTFTGSQEDGIHVEAAGNPAGTYCNVDLLNNTVSNVWDWQDYLATSTLHSGQNGNGIDIDSCSHVRAENNQIFNVEFSGIRVYNGWDNRIVHNFTRYAHEQAMYAEFNSQGNLFESNTVLDSMFGTNDNNAEQRAALRPNYYLNNIYRNIQGTGLQCNACVAQGNTFDGVVEGISLGGGSAGGYNSQVIDNHCMISSDPNLPPMVDCISYGNAYGGTSALIQGNNTIGGTPRFGHIWGNGNGIGHITSVTQGSVTTVRYTGPSTGQFFSGNYACFFGIELESMSELNGNCYVASAVDGSSFTIPVDSTSFRPWIAYQSLANPTSANGWRFPSFWYDGNLSTSPSVLNSNVLIRDERIKDAIKGTPKVGSSVTIIDDDCSGGALSNLGTGNGTTARYTTSGWVCSQ